MVDWNYHCIRRAIYVMYCIFNILKKNKDSFQKSQIRKVLHDISKLSIIERSPREFYDYLKNEQEKYKNEEKYQFPYFPLCNLSHKQIFNSYSLKIKKI